MDTHYALSDAAFEQQFASASLPPQLFTHEAHLRLAWIHVTRYGVEAAVENVCEQIAGFDRKFGDGSKFHKTVTVASVRAVAHFIGRSSADNFKDFIAAFPRLKSHLKALLAQHYSWDIFQDPAARRNYLAPDLAGF